MNSEFKDIITIGLGAVGAVLGVMNTWRALNQNRIRLKVTPVHAITNDQQVDFGIEVVNLSNFAVTIIEVGVAANFWRGIHGKRAVLANPILFDGKPWPRRLEPREAFTAYCLSSRLFGEIRISGSAYVKTACRNVKYGTSPAGKQITAEHNAQIIF